MDKVSYLMKERQIKGYDINEIYKHTKGLKPTEESHK